MFRNPLSKALLMFIIPQLVTDVPAANSQRSGGRLLLYIYIICVFFSTALRDTKSCGCGHDPLESADNLPNGDKSIHRSTNQADVEAGRTTEKLIFSFCRKISSFFF